jgi:hypothetical protein
LAWESCRRQRRQRRLGCLPPLVLTGRGSLKSARAGLIRSNGGHRILARRMV